MVGIGFRSGLFYGALTSLAASVCMSLVWSTKATFEVGTFVTLMLLWVPGVTVLGAGVCGVIYAIVGGALEWFGRTIRASPLSCALLGCAVLLVVVMPGASLIAGTVGSVLAGLFLLPTAVTGGLVGWSLSRK